MNLRRIASLALLLTLGLHIRLFGQDVVRKTIEKYFEDDPATVKLRLQIITDNSGSMFKDGFYKEYFPTGQLKVEGSFELDDPAGEWTYYFSNGAIDKKGSFDEGKTSGKWTYYFSNGNINMEGDLVDGVQQGGWKFYYPSGSIKEEGIFQDGKGQGKWRFYYETGELKGEAYLQDGGGKYSEFFKTGGVKKTGKLIDGEGEGDWKYFHSNGTLKARGAQSKGLKEGMWEYYNPEGKLDSKGPYKNGKEEGTWEFYYDNGNLKSIGLFRNGQKQGEWMTYYRDGTPKGKGVFSNGSGVYQEFHPNGQQKLSGNFEDGKQQGTWHFWDSLGNQSAVCVYDSGKGNYTSFYPDGKIHLEGTLEEGERTGVWKYYDQEGKLAEIVSMDTAKKRYTDLVYKDYSIGEAEGIPDMDKVPVSSSKMKVKRGLRYFRAVPNEIRGVIFSANPITTLFGRLPISVEYYYQNRLGYELRYTYIRNPFFRAHDLRDKATYLTGDQIDFRMKFYHPGSGFGRLYISNEIRLSNLQYAAVASGQDESLRLNYWDEQSVEYSFQLGVRGIHKNRKRSFTMDVYFGAGVGYRNTTDNIQEEEARELLEDDISSEPFFATFRAGFTFGYFLGDRYSLFKSKL